MTEGVKEERGRETGRTEEMVMRWSGPPPKQCPVVFYFSHEVTSFSSLQKNTRFPLVYRRWTLLFALHPCAL